jgi:hypothetical protein
MNTVIISAHEQITKWYVAIDRHTDLSGQPDNVYPFAGPSTSSGCESDEDRWAVVISEKQIAWTAEYGTACMIYISALQAQREHSERCPSDSIPFDGMAPEATDDGNDDTGLSEVTL